jgi:PDZ domain-containing protein
MTGGLHIAGTGEIDNDGTVGAIGGIQQKIAGAARAGATAFLVPADNCTDALEADRADELTLVRVSTLAEARDAVEALADDPDADVPVCAA